MLVVPRAGWVVGVGGSWDRWERGVDGRSLGMIVVQRLFSVFFVSSVCVRSRVRARAYVFAPACARAAPLWMCVFWVMKLAVKSQLVNICLCAASSNPQRK